jgi:U3 small nucleolar RNA-associated protein 7
MITLDPEFVGSLAPPSKLSTNMEGKPDIPFARLPRLERLRIQGKDDEMEEEDGDEGAVNENDKKKLREETEKRKMRGKGKSLKRFVSLCSFTG